VLRLIAIAIAVALGSAAAAQPAPEAEPPPSTMGPAGADLPRLPSRLDDGRRVALPPMVIQQERPVADRRPMYIGGGLIVLALVFWWNRRRRDRFEREDGIESPRRPRREPRNVDRDADRDADDLHAAARGDGPAPEPTEAAPPDSPTGNA